MACAGRWRLGAGGWDEVVSLDCVVEAGLVWEERLAYVDVPGQVSMRTMFWICRMRTYVGEM